jgi:GDP-L-fucose synthase
LWTVEIWGTGAPMREFLWSEEMADACVFLMENINFTDVISKELRLRDLSQQSSKATDSSLALGMTEIRNTHINIGTGKEVSIKQLAEQIKETIGFKGELKFNTSKPDGTMRKLTDVSKLHALGWHHQIEIEEGIQKIYEWYIK